jgi:hypothetical protein
VLEVLESRGRSIVAQLAAGQGSHEAAFEQVRSYQALLVGHVDYARRPSPAAFEALILRGHVEYILTLLGLMEGLRDDVAASERTRTRGAPGPA